MRKKEIKDTEQNAALDDIQEQLIRSRVSELEDRSKIPRPEIPIKNPLLRFIKKDPLTFSVLLTLAIALVTSLVLIAVYLVNMSLGAKNTDDYIFYYGKTQVVQRYDECVIDDVLYVDMSALAEYAELTVTGSHNTQKYLVDNDTYMKFIDGSPYAIINGSAVSISPPAIVKDGECLVPYKILTKIFDGGIELRIDIANNEVFVKRLTYERDDILYYYDISLTAKELAPYISPVPGSEEQDG